MVDNLEEKLASPIFNVVCACEQHLCKLIMQMPTSFATTELAERTKVERAIFTDILSMVEKMAGINLKNSNGHIICRNL